MNNNKLKTLLKNKQKTISREQGYPGLRSGKDGDLQVRRVEGQGIFLFYKWSNKWYSTRLTQHRPTTAEHKQPVKIPLGVEPSSLGDIAMDSDGLIKVKKSKSNKSQMVSMNTSNLLDIAEIKAERDTTTDMSATASGASDLHLLNKTGYTYMLLETQGSSYDPFIVYGYRQAGESIELKQWITGMDNSNSDTFCIYYKSGDNAPLTPSTTTASHKKFEIDISGNVTTLGTLTIGSITEVGSNTDKILMSDSGVVKYVTGANLRSYIGAGTSSVAALNDLSDVTYSSGDLTISSLDTIISGALTIDSSGSITIDSVNSSGAITDGTLFKTNGTTFGSITTHHALSTFTLFEAGGSSTDDYLEIQVDAAGATSINTVDAGGATAHLTLNPDGNVFVSGAHLTLDAAKEIVLDGSGGHTKISESTADFMNFQVGGQDLMAIQEKAATSVAQSSKIYTGCPVMLKDIGGAADTPVSGYGSIYVNGDTLYFKDDGGNVSNITAINPIVSAMIFG